jgi:transaldolase
MNAHGQLDALEQILVAHGRSSGETCRPELAETPLLAALKHAGTSHIYGDTADVEELGGVIALEDGAIRQEVDGNTVNQPLLRKVAEPYLDAGEPRRWQRELEARQAEMPREELMPLIYAILCGRVGNDMSRAFASGRSWEVSLQLHMQLRHRPDTARWVGRMLRQMVPSCIVKVPFAPDAPECFLVARDLEVEGVPVNFTSTFSARQAVAAAMLADVTRTNIFMGRLDQGLQADLLGEHAVLEAQRALRHLRQQDDLKTQLIVASMRKWQSFVDLAGCDVFTSPCDAIRGFLEQQEVEPAQIESRLETSYEDRLGVPEEVAKKLAPEGPERLYRVEPELVEFLRDLRTAREYANLDGELLYKRFDQAGFGDLFHAPGKDEREELARGKLPELDGLLVQRIPIDTHYSLLANADFERNQAAIDEQVDKRLEGGR